MALRYKRLLRRSSVVAALVTLIGWAFYAQAPSTADAKHQWQTLNAQVVQAYQAGDYAKGIPLAEKALNLARRTFGNRDPQALTSLNNLALLYEAQGRYGKAEPLLKEGLQASREVLGPRHPDTLTSLNNLAMLYYAQGRYGEAEPLLKEALQASRELLGSRHLDTLQSLNNLAFLYQAQGRYEGAGALARAGTV